MFNGLQHDDPPLERNGQGSEFEVAAERATVVVNARKRLHQCLDVDGPDAGDRFD